MLHKVHRNSDFCVSYMYIIILYVFITCCYKQIVASFLWVLGYFQNKNIGQSCKTFILTYLLTVVQNHISVSSIKHEQTDLKLQQEVSVTVFVKGQSSIHFNRTIYKKKLIKHKPLQWNRMHDKLPYIFC